MDYIPSIMYYIPSSITLYNSVRTLAPQPLARPLHSPHGASSVASLVDLLFRPLVELLLRPLEPPLLGPLETPLVMALEPPLMAALRPTLLALLGPAKPLQSGPLETWLRRP